MIACALACGGQDHRQPLVHMAVIEESVEANPNNVISAVFTVHAAGAGSVRVEIAGEPTGTRVSREIAIGDETVKIPILGLLPDTDYEFRPILQSVSGTAMVGEWIPFRTGSLPDTIVSMVATTTGVVQPGLTLLSPRRLGNPSHPAIIIDQTGRVVWYHDVPAGVADFQLQPNGHLTAWAGTFFEWDALGNVVARWTANGYDQTNAHEIRLVGETEVIRTRHRELLHGLRSAASERKHLGQPRSGLSRLRGDVRWGRGLASQLADEWRRVLWNLPRIPDRVARCPRARRPSTERVTMAAKCTTTLQFARPAATVL